MTVFTITIADQAFDKKSAEVQFIAAALEVAAAEIQRGQGTVTTGGIVGKHPNGHGQSLGSWTYTPSASNP
jgi:hypothetical protein